MLTTINIIQANKGIKLNKKFIALISVMLMVFAACASEGEAGPAGPAVARVEVHCKLQTVTSCALATASTAVMEVSSFSKVLLLGNVEVGQATYMG